MHAEALTGTVLAEEWGRSASWCYTHIECLQPFSALVWRGRGQH